MAIISQLRLANYRNIKAQTFDFSPRFNLITGQNGQGKTNLIEAIYFLAHNKSFKTKHIEKIITNSAHTLTLVGRTNNGDEKHTLKTNKSQHKSQITIDGIKQKNTVTSSQLLPVQLISADRGFIVSAEPKIKRQFLDWGVFHVKQNSNYYYSQYKKTLSQINVLLLKQVKTDDLMVWLQKLAELMATINTLRQFYLDLLLKIKKEKQTNYQTLLQGDFSFNLNFGLPQSVAVFDSEQIALFLKKQHKQFQKTGYVAYGCHRANISFSFKDKPIEFCSRGEQKMLSIVFALLQVDQLHQVNKKAIILLDDIASEIDNAKNKKLLNFISALDLQVILTAINTPSSVKQMADVKRFKVNQGVFNVVS